MEIGNAEDEKEKVDEAEASFSITGDKLVPDAITLAVGLEPSRSWRKGDSTD